MKVDTDAHFPEHVSNTINVMTRLARKDVLDRRFLSERS